MGALQANSVVCATAYTLSSASDRFDTLVQCFGKMGFTTPCATLWAHLSAATTSQCASLCVPDGTGYTKLNEDDPPVCEFAPCLACSQDFQTDFDAIAGRTLYNSGITERIVRPCSVFGRVDHDACVGTTEVGDVPCADSSSTNAPAPSPTGSSPSPPSGANSLSVVGSVLVGFFTVYITTAMTHGLLG